MWPFDMFASASARREAVERAEYALHTHADDPVGYLRAKLAMPGRSRRSIRVLKLALNEAVRRRS